MNNKPCLLIDVRSEVAHTSQEEQMMKKWSIDIKQEAEFIWIIIKIVENHNKNRENNKY